MSANASSPRSLAVFLSGTLVLWVALASPLATADHARLTFHMLQHLLLMTIAAPLVLLAQPVAVLRQGLPDRLIDHLLSPVLHRLRRVGEILTHPVSCWIAGTAVVIAWHIPPVFELGMRSHFWHSVQHGCFLAGGLLFWWPVIQPWPAIAKWPRWSMPLYLFFATLPCDALSAFLAFCGRVIYSSHGAAADAAYAARLEDQELAGALMWCWVTFAYVIPAVVITIQLLGVRVSLVDKGARDLTPLSTNRTALLGFRR